MSMRAMIATFQCDECGETEIVEIDLAKPHSISTTTTISAHDIAIDEISSGGHFSSLHISGETSKGRPTSIGCSESGAPWQTMCRDCTAKTEKP